MNGHKPRVWMKRSIRLKLAQLHNYGVQETFTIAFGRHKADVLCYMPYGKGAARTVESLVDEEMVTRFWMLETIEKFKQKLSNCGNALDCNCSMKLFVDYIQINDGCVRVSSIV